MLIDLFFERSEQAVKGLSDRYGKLAQVVCANILKNGADAEECVNDALLSTWNAIPPSRPVSLRAFFIDIARKKALDRYRYNSAARRNSEYEVALDELEECLKGGGTPAEDCEAKVLTEAIDRFLKTLKKQDRIMFVSRYYLSDPIPVIAENTGLKESVVSVRLYRTREKLRTFLRKEDLI
jgi:RNA polymerase sigma-70 factor (ECF subfamily)